MRRIRFARFALGKPIAPITDIAAGFIGHQGQYAGQTKRLLDELDRPIESWASRSQIKNRFPTLERGASPRLRQQNAKDKLMGLIRKVRKRSGKVYWSKPQLEDAAVKSALIPGQRRIKALADNYKGGF